MDHFVKNFLFQLKKGKKKKDCDPMISAVTNIHTRFYIQIREYPSTRILAAALSICILFSRDIFKPDDNISLKGFNIYNYVHTDCLRPSIFIKLSFPQNKIDLQTELLFNWCKWRCFRVF